MKIGIIGAGASGLAALKHSLDEGHDCELLEQTGYVGGIWRYVEKVGLDEFGLPIHTAMYEDLRTILPKELMMFEDFPHKKELTYSYLSHQEVLEYIEAYAEFFKLSPHIKFYHHVEVVSPKPGEKWSVQVKNLKANMMETKEFDSIMICVGEYSNPIVPELPGKNRFGGRMIHSHDYRNPQPYKNKRVLIVGNGPSGIGIASKVFTVANKVFQCQRTPTKIKLEMEDGVIIKPEINEIFENSVKFIDGSEEEIDDIILCTGYKISMPFLTPQCGLEVDDNYIKYLYKHTINVEHPSMAIIGIPRNIPLFPMFCLQARFHLAFLRGNLKVTKEEMRQDVEKYIEDCKQSGQNPHMRLEKVYKQYFEDLATLADITPIKPVIPKIFHFLREGAYGNFDIRFTILNDEDFEHMLYEDNDVNKKQK